MICTLRIGHATFAALVKSFIIEWPTEKCLDLPAAGANSRLTVSRNKREGRFAGKRPDLHICPTTYRVMCKGARRQREGQNGWLSLHARRPG